MTDSTLDATYLSAALRRAGRSLGDERARVSIEPLLDGRTGASVVELRSGDATYVVKTVPSSGWRAAGMRCPESGEPRLWSAGIAQRLPPSVRWPVLDVSPGPSDSFRVLMENVGAGIRERGRFTKTETRTLFRAVAEMHARNYEDEWLQRAPLPSIDGNVRVFVEPVLHAAGVRFSSESWVTDMLRDFTVLPTFLPGFLELLGPQMADAWLALAGDDVWRARLLECRPTMLHGDLRRANIAFENDGVALIDWELAAAGPPGCDLQWHVLVNYWAYPPEGAAPGDDCDDLRDFYIDAFERASARPVDRDELVEGWALGFIKAMTTVGYLLYESRRRELAVRAVQRAIDAREALG